MKVVSRSQILCFSFPLRRLAAVLIVVNMAFASVRPPQSAQHSAAYRSMEQKLAYLRENAAKPYPDRHPTELTQAEVNAYFNEGGVKLPKGVTHLQLTAMPAVVDGTAKVDFDAITAAKRSSNPLLSLFRGMHDVRVVAQAAGIHGMASVRVQSVYLDGVEVPQIALEFFVERYITPKYPNVGLNSTFKVPLRVDTAIVHAGAVSIMQK